MEKKKLANYFSRWVNNDKVKIGKCKKCNEYKSVGWLFPHMKMFRDSCSDCNNFSWFIVQDNLKFIDNEKECYGIVVTHPQAS